MRQRGRSLSTRCQRTWTQKGMQAGERREQRHWPVNIRETRGAVYVDAARYPGRRNASAAVVVSATTGKLLTASTVRARTAGQAVEAAIALATATPDSDICDDEDVSLDDGEDQSDESSSDEEEEENVCAAEDPLDTLPPSPKTRKMEEWQWEEDDSVENIVKHSFSGQPGIKRSIELQPSPK
ncbi:hypothetical protein MRX96_049171 [Rhipicephalus microplus]